MKARKSAARCWLPAVSMLMMLPAARAATAAEPIPVREFARAPEFTTAELSPDGAYVALLVPNEKNSALAFIRLADGKQSGHLKLEGGNHIESFAWVNNTRVVASLAIQEGPLDAPQLTGELVAVNADGSSYSYLFGRRGDEKTLGSRLAARETRDDGSASVVDPLSNEHDEILVQTRQWSAHEQTRPVLYRLNVYNGHKTRVDSGPAPGWTSFIVDPQGQARYAVAWEGGLNNKAYQKAAGQTEWQAMALGDAAKASATPLRFSKDGKSVFLESGEFGPTTCLVQLVLETGERRKLACSDSGDLSDVIWSFEEHGDPIAAAFAGGKGQVRTLDTGNPNAPILKLLLDAFPGKIVDPISSTRDGKRVLVFVSDDRTPGDYYLFNTETRKADYFAGLRQALNPEQMAERRPIALKARDGTPLHGFLTLPPGADPKKLPLVVNPHGGPFRIADHWAFDTEPQLLASRGYAVLQINFRGSGGYGDAFVEAGSKAWGTSMIDDITDATRWTIAQGYADAGRVCIYGGSYGGFAALMSAVREPELYKCVVGYAGVYDLALMKRDTDIREIKAGRRYFDEAIAGSDAEMAAQSPMTYLDRLRAPVLIVHGEQDHRAPFTQAKALRSAMDERHLPYEWLSRGDEGHGFWKEENITAFYEKMLAFLDRNIGKAAASGPAATAASGS